MLKVKSGRKAGLPSLDPGELGYAFDTEEFVIGSEDGNVILNEIDGNEWPAEVTNNG